MHLMKSASLAVLLAAGLLASPGEATAQWRKKKAEPPVTTTQVVVAQEKKTEKKTIKELVKGHRKIEGLFTFYQDTTSGEIKMLISKEQLGKEYLYFSQIADGVTEASAFRGAYGESKIFKTERYFNRIEFVTQNTSYYFDPQNPLSRSADANISPGIMASAKIEAQDDELGLYLIRADNLFLKETFVAVKPASGPFANPFGFKLGSLDGDKTKVLGIRNYEQNTDLAVEYVFSSPSNQGGVSNAVTDDRNVSIKVYHSLIEIPDNGYEARFDDPRVGYFNTQVTDMTSSAATPYRDMIHRWDLRKKDPDAMLSEPVEPIVWWIENSTPHEWRETIAEAVLEWNKAFEHAGFKDAIQVKVQPDDADWDAGDIRYNVLRWTSSPNPPFGGYGPSFVNPRTGQILGSDIMLEFVYHTNRVVMDKVFSDLTAFENEAMVDSKDPHLFCVAGHHMQHSMVFGQTVLMAAGASDMEMVGMRKEAMKELLMHEVGHTLGLNHNMKASQLYSPKELKDPNFTRGKALSGSVMDYLAINVNKDKESQGHYFSTTIGPYDKWAITFGYKEVDKAGLDAILAESTKPEHIFGNDADDMRSPGKGIDPRVMIGDLSNDQIQYSVDRMDLIKDLMKDVKGKYTKEGESFHELNQAYNVLMGQYGTSAGVISRFIGGVYVDRSMAGQEGAAQPFTPVSLKDQKRAMKALDQYVFAPDAFAVPSDLYNYLAVQRRGFNFFSGPEDPKVHDQVLRYQRNVLAHLLHYNTLQRINDSQMYGNEYDLATYMNDLTKSIFDADINRKVNTFRQNLQLEYVDNLKEIVAGKNTHRFSHLAKSSALYNLNYIKGKVSNGSGDLATKAHKDHVKLLIENTLKEVK